MDDAATTKIYFSSACAPNRSSFFHRIEPIFRLLIFPTPTTREDIAEHCIAFLSINTQQQLGVVSHIGAKSNHIRNFLTLQFLATRYNVRREMHFVQCPSLLKLTLEGFGPLASAYRPRAWHLPKVQRKPRKHPTHRFIQPTILATNKRRRSSVNWLQLVDKRREGPVKIFEVLLVYGESVGGARRRGFVRCRSKIGFQRTDPIV